MSYVVFFCIDLQIVQWTEGLVLMCALSLYLYIHPAHWTLINIATANCISVRSLIFDSAPLFKLLFWFGCICIQGSQTLFLALWPLQTAWSGSVDAQPTPRSSTTLIFCPTAWSACLSFCMSTTARCFFPLLYHSLRRPPFVRHCLIRQRCLSCLFKVQWV